MDKRSREEIAEEMSRFEKAIENNHDASQREIIEQLGVPRSTLRHWLDRKESIDAAPEVIDFFESPGGTAFLHRLVLGAHYVFTLCSPCGIRPVCLYLELTGLDRFVASSYGSQQKVSVSMEEESVEFGRKETGRLAAEMPHKKISIAEDETFHPETCLVAVEPVSNYILLEKYASGRKSVDWTSAFKEATESLNIETIQCTSDEGRGIVSHVTNDLKAHHSPDLFHVQQEIIKGTSIVLESRKKKADKVLAQDSEEVSLHEKAKETFFTGKRPVGRAPNFDKRIKKARDQEEKARKALETAEKHRESVKQAVKGISNSYHPFDLETGAPRSPEQVSSLIENHFAIIEQAASEASLPERCNKKIQKAKRVLVKMTASVAFFFLMIWAKIEALSLAPEVEQAVINQLIPGIYLDIVSKKAKTKEQRDILRKRSEDILLPLQSRHGPFKGLSQDEIVTIENVAVECAQLFQRSSSCVEGRNGHLSLYHHSLHRLSNRKLEALTVVHNFFIKRSDKTTAAERFFGSKPKDMFEWLLERIDLPGRPAQKRSHPESKSYLLQQNAS
ncbi:DUF6399 domain-containing protein [Desulfobacterales bacterium HSG17]|nr:DUF6399 domain-containing protein [Desulfobacterales bacterium HSG17]